MKRLVVLLVLVLLLSSSMAMGYGDYGITGRGLPRRRFDYGYNIGGWYGGRVGYGYSYNYYDYRYPGYYGHPNTNVNVKERERWDAQGGEYSYEQSPSVEGKLIDLATILGVFAIIFH